MTAYLEIFLIGHWHWKIFPNENFFDKKIRVNHLITIFMFKIEEKIKWVLNI